MSFVKICGQKLHNNISGKFGEIRAKILRTPKNLPAPTPMPVDTLTAISFPQSMIARLVLNLLKSRDSITVLHQSITFDSFPL